MMADSGSPVPRGEREPSRLPGNSNFRIARHPTANCGLHPAERSEAPTVRPPRMKGTRCSSNGDRKRLAFLSFRLSTDAQFLQVRHKGSPLSAPEAFNHSGLHLFPLLPRFLQDSVALGGDDCGTGAGVYSRGDFYPVVPQHGIEGSIQGAPVHLQFFSNMHERLACPAADAAQNG